MALIGSFGRFWERDLVDFEGRGWRLLGRQGANRGTLRVADFRNAKGVYILYNEVGVYYVGLAAGQGGIGRRLKDHLDDDHAGSWTRFSWFAFESVGNEAHDDGVLMIDPTYSGVDADSPIIIRDMEALLQIAMQPFGNRNETRFAEHDEWYQVATRQLRVLSFEEDYKAKIAP